MNDKKKNTSFTLIELLVVIVIIGVLAAVIVVTTTSSISKANIAKLKVFEESIANNLSANMVSRWKLDEINGSGGYTTPDSWGNNMGTFVGTTTTLQTVDCASENCLYFSGGADYVNFGSDSSLQDPSFTVAFWLNQFDNTIRGIVDKRSLPTDGIGWRIFHNSVNIEFDGSGEIGNLIVTHDIGNWLYIVASYDNDSHTMKLYKNGILGDSESSVTLNNANNKPFLIGSYASGYFKGSLDDVRMYNEALSSSQVKQNYIAGLNSMLANGSISKTEYNRRIESLGTSL